MTEVGDLILRAGEGGFGSVHERIARLVAFPGDRTCEGRVGGRVATGSPGDGLGDDVLSVGLAVRVVDLVPLLAIASAAAKEAIHLQGIPVGPKCEGVTTRHVSGTCVAAEITGVAGPEPGELPEVVRGEGAGDDHVVTKRRAAVPRWREKLSVELRQLGVRSEVGCEVHWVEASLAGTGDDLDWDWMLRVLPVERAGDAEDAREIAGVVQRPAVRLRLG